jgi:hypothetical protein
MILVNGHMLNDEYMSQELVRDGELILRVQLLRPEAACLAAK